MSIPDMVDICDSWTFGAFLTIGEADQAACAAMGIHNIFDELTIKDMYLITGIDIPAGEEELLDQYGWIIGRDENVVSIEHDEENDTYAVKIDKRAKKLNRMFS